MMPLAGGATDTQIADSYSAPQAGDATMDATTDHQQNKTDKFFHLENPLVR